MIHNLPHPVHFILRRPEKWQFLLKPDTGALNSFTADDLHELISTNEECWILSSYLQLRHRVGNVFLSDRLVEDAICVVSGLDFGIRDFDLRSFFVGARSDGPWPALCNLVVVQNHLQERQGAGRYIPHWPQPALIPRSLHRENRIENIVFYGSEANLDDRFLAPEFLRELANLGVRLRVNGGSSSTVRWNDYTDADLVLAARNLTRLDALTKPASKLVNAWLAGVPALLGPEPVFQGLRKSELDYFEVRTARDVIGAIVRLKHDPGLYQECMRNGLKRAVEFNADAVAERWIEFLGFEVAPAFEAWRRRTSVSKTASFVSGAVAHKLARGRAGRARGSGQRILDTP